MQIKIRKLPRKYKTQPTYASFAVKFFFVFLICIFVFVFALGKKSTAKCRASPHIPAQVASNPIDLQRKKPALCQPPSLHFKSQDFSRSRPLHFKSPDFLAKQANRPQRTTLDRFTQQEETHQCLSTFKTTLSLLYAKTILSNQTSRNFKRTQISQFATSGVHYGLLKIRQCHVDCGLLFPPHFLSFLQ